MRVRHVAGAGLAIGAALLVLARPAGAEVFGPCSGTLAGVDVAPLSSSDPDDAIEVEDDEVITVGATASAPISSYDVEMEFAGFTWTVATGEANGNSWTRDVNVGDYARFGVGLYKVGAVSNGVDCSGAVLVRVNGNPLTTVVGAFSMILAAGATVGAVQSIRKSARARPSQMEAFDTDVSSPADVSNAISRAQSAPDYVETVCRLGGAGATFDEVTRIVCYGDSPVRERVISLCGKGWR